MSQRAIKLFLIRHCQDLGSQYSKFDDLKLTVEGENQANQIALYLSKYKINKIISSPQLRSIQTANIISKKIGLPIITDERVADRNVGLAKGLTYQQFQKRYPNFFKQPSFGINFKFPEGESNGEVYLRANNFASELKKQSIGTNELIVVISHPLTLNYLIYNLQSLDFQDKLFYLFEPGMGCTLKRDLNNPNFQLIRFDNFYDKINEQS